MKRRLALLALVGLITALAVPAGAKSVSTFGLAGEARALDFALLNNGVTLGLAAAEGDSLPQAKGVGAGQCTLLGDVLPDIADLPCTSSTTVTSQFPGNPGGSEKCGSGLPAPLNAIIDLKTACGSSKAALLKDLPSVSSTGKVAELAAQLPVDLLLPIDTDAATDQVEAVVDELTGVLAPVLDVAPADVRGAVDALVDDLLVLIDNVQVSDLVKVQLGPSTSDIIPSGDKVTVESTAAGALIGVLGLPSVDGTSVTPGDALTNGLIIVEVGTAQASATVDNATATATGAASAALVTVKVRNLLTNDYIELSVAPGQTITLLEGTPLETTIVAADTQVVEDAKGARAAADAVRVHALKGIDGGVKLGLARATAAAQGAQKKLPVAPKKKPPVLPVTGGTDFTAVALVLMLAAAGTLVLRRRFSTR